MWTCLCFCVRVATFNLQEDSFWPWAVWIAWIRKEEAAGHQQEHDDENWAQTHQDPLSAPYQIDEMKLRQKRKYNMLLDKQSTQQSFWNYHRLCQVFFIVIHDVGTLTKKEERKMVARVTREARTTSGGISVPLRPMMGVKISNTTQMRNMKWIYGNARPNR